MKYIIKVSPEITIKSKFVRKQAIKLLARNIRLHLKTLSEGFDVKAMWNKVEVIMNENKQHLERNKIRSVIKKVTWIENNKDLILKETS